MSLKFPAVILYYFKNYFYLTRMHLMKSNFESFSSHFHRFVKKVRFPVLAVVCIIDHITFPWHLSIQVITCLFSSVFSQSSSRSMVEYHQQVHLAGQESLGFATYLIYLSFMACFVRIHKSVCVFLQKSLLKYVATCRKLFISDCMNSYAARIMLVNTLLN